MVSYGFLGVETVGKGEKVDGREGQHDAFWRELLGRCCMLARHFRAACKPLPRYHDLT